MALRKLLLISALFIGISSSGQTPMYKLLRKHQSSACSKLLDQYSGATAAYSLRLLDCDYSENPAIRVRRSSDDAEQDIGFDGNGDLDVSSLITFTGNGAGNDGFVVTWYDQSGNGNNATQSTAANQPQIVDEGAVLTQGGLPSISFDGTNDYLTKSSLAINVYTSLYVVLRAVNSAKPMFIEHGPDAANNEGFYFYGSNGDSWTFNRSLGGGGLHRASGVSNWVSSGTGSDLALADLQYNGTGAFYLNNSAQANNTVNGSANPNVSTTKDLFIFSRNGSSLFTEGYLSEFVLYASDQSSNRSNIVSNINTYYTIY